VLNLFGPISAFLAVALVTLAVAITYYMRPSRGEHANPRGAATTVATLRAQIEHEPPRPVPTPGTPYGLLCGYDLPTVVIMDLATAPALVRPYLDDPDYRRAALMALMANEPTMRLRPLVAA
jgi:hypothetical protein